MPPRLAEQGRRKRNEVFTPRVPDVAVDRSDAGAGHVGVPDPILVEERQRGLQRVRKEGERLWLLVALTDPDLLDHALPLCAGHAADQVGMVLCEVSDLGGEQGSVAEQTVVAEVGRVREQAVPRMEAAQRQPGESAVARSWEGPVVVLDVRDDCAEQLLLDEL